MLSARPVRPLLAVAAFSVAACSAGAPSTAEGTDPAAAAVAAAATVDASKAAIAAALGLTPSDVAAPASPASLPPSPLDVLPRTTEDGRPAPGNVQGKVAAPSPPPRVAMRAPQTVR